jgi:hypothetical protein
LLAIGKLNLIKMKEEDFYGIFEENAEELDFSDQNLLDDVYD